MTDLVARAVQKLQTTETECDTWMEGQNPPNDFRPEVIALIEATRSLEAADRVGIALAIEDVIVSRDALCRAIVGDAEPTPPSRILVIAAHYQQWRSWARIHGIELHNPKYVYVSNVSQIYECRGPETAAVRIGTPYERPDFEEIEIALKVAHIEDLTS